MSLQEQYKNFSEPSLLSNVILVVEGQHFHVVKEVSLFYIHPDYEIRMYVNPIENLIF